MGKDTSAARKGLQAIRATPYGQQGGSSDPASPSSTSPRSPTFPPSSPRLSGRRSLPSRPTSPVRRRTLSDPTQFAQPVAIGAVMTGVQEEEEEGPMAPPPVRRRGSSTSSFRGRRGSMRSSDGRQDARQRPPHPQAAQRWKDPTPRQLSSNVEAMADFERGIVIGTGNLNNPFVWKSTTTVRSLGGEAELLRQLEAQEQATSPPPARPLNYRIEDRDVVRRSFEAVFNIIKLPIPYDFPWSEAYEHAFARGLIVDPPSTPSTAQADAQSLALVVARPKRAAARPVVRPRLLPAAPPPQLLVEVVLYPPLYPFDPDLDGHVIQTGNWHSPYHWFSVREVDRLGIDHLKQQVAHEQRALQAGQVSTPLSNSLTLQHKTDFKGRVNVRVVEGYIPRTAFEVVRGVLKLPMVYDAHWYELRNRFLPQYVPRAYPPQALPAPPSLPHPPPQALPPPSPHGQLVFHHHYGEGRPPVTSHFQPVVTQPQRRLPPGLDGDPPSPKMREDVELSRPSTRRGSSAGSMGRPSVSQPFGTTVHPSAAQVLVGPSSAAQQENPFAYNPQLPQTIDESFASLGVVGAASPDLSTPAHSLDSLNTGAASAWSERGRFRVDQQVPRRPPPVQQGAPQFSTYEQSPQFVEAEYQRQLAAQEEQERFSASTGRAGGPVLYFGPWLHHTDPAQAAALRQRRQAAQNYPPDPYGAVLHQPHPTQPNYPPLSTVQAQQASLQGQPPQQQQGQLVVRQPQQQLPPPIQPQYLDPPRRMSFGEAGQVIYDENYQAVAGPSQFGGNVVSTMSSSEAFQQELRLQQTGEYDSPEHEQADVDAMLSLSFLFDDDTTANPQPSASSSSATTMQEAFPQHFPHSAPAVATSPDSAREQALAVAHEAAAYALQQQAQRQQQRQRQQQQQQYVDPASIFLPPSPEPTQMGPVFLSPPPGTSSNQVVQAANAGQHVIYPSSIEEPHGHGRSMN